MRPLLHGPVDLARAKERELVEGPRLEPRVRRTWGWVWVAIGIALASVAVAAAWGIQQIRLDDARSSLAGAQSVVVVVQNREIAALGVRLDRMGDRLAAEATRLQEREAQLEARNEALRGRFADARALLGPPIAHGRYSVELRMVGGNQSPPMVAFDRVRIFTGEEAAAAALADGVDPFNVPDDPVNDYYYIRNLDPTWQIVPVTIDARIVLQSWRFQKEGGYQPVEVTLSQFHRIFNGTAEWNHHLRWQHFSVQVADGEVVSIEEFNLSP